jgi:hypothetical protein
MPIFSALTAKIASGAALALFLALGVVMWRADAISDQRDALRDKLAASDAKLAVSKASIDTLTASITELNNRALASAQAYAAAKVEAAKASARLDALSRESDRRIAALRAAAKEQYNGDCPTPEALAELAKGL